MLPTQDKLTCTPSLVPWRGKTKASISGPNNPRKSSLSSHLPVDLLQEVRQYRPESPAPTVQRVLECSAVLTQGVLQDRPVGQSIAGLNITLHSTRVVKERTDACANPSQLFSPLPMDRVVDLVPPRRCVLPLPKRQGTDRQTGSEAWQTPHKPGWGSTCARAIHSLHAYQLPAESSAGKHCDGKYHPSHR
jgi:hypothetical protein